MKNKDIIIFIICLVVGGLIPLTIFGIDFYFKKEEEVQLHDSYFIFAPFHCAIVTIGWTLFVVFLFRVIGTGFKNLLALAFFALGTIILATVVVAIYIIANAPVVLINK